jgi:hypothetical protein
MARPASENEVDVSEVIADESEAAEAEEAGPPALREFVLVPGVCAETKPRRSI